MSRFGKRDGRIDQRLRKGPAAIFWIDRNAANFGRLLVVSNQLRIVGPEPRKLHEEVEGLLLTIGKTEQVLQRIVTNFEKQIGDLRDIGQFLPAMAFQHSRAANHFTLGSDSTKRDRGSILPIDFPFGSRTLVFIPQKVAFLPYPVAQGKISRPFFRRCRGAYFHLPAPPAAN